MSDRPTFLQFRCSWCNAPNAKHFDEDGDPACEKCAQPGIKLPPSFEELRRTIALLNPKTPVLSLEAFRTRMRMR